MLQIDRNHNRSHCSFQTSTTITRKPHLFDVSLVFTVGRPPESHIFSLCRWWHPSADHPTDSPFRFVGALVQPVRDDNAYANKPFYFMESLLTITSVLPAQP